MKPYMDTSYKIPCPNVDIEDQPRANLVVGFLMDLDGQEQSYLEDFARAEAGEAQVEAGNNHVDATFYADGRVVLESLFYTEEHEAREGPRKRAQITLVEAKQLILDWLQVKQQYWQSRERT